MPFHPGFIGKARLQLAQQASSTSTGLTITLPTTIAGDVMVIFNTASNNAGAPAAITPSGFTSILNVTAGNVRATAFYKKADGTEGGTTVAVMNGGITKDAMCYTFRGTPAVNSISPTGVQNEVTSNDPAGQTVGSGSGVAPLIVMCGYRSTAAVSPRTFSPAKGGEINSSANAFLAFLIQNTTAADVSVDMDDEGNDNVLASFYLQCQ